MKLVKMIDYVLEKECSSENISDTFYKILSYARFLKTPLEIGMLVPLDKGGNIFVKPSIKGFPPDDIPEQLNDLCFDYMEAESKVLLKIKGLQYVTYCEENSFFYIYYSGGILALKGKTVVGDLLSLNTEVTIRESFIEKYGI